MVTNALLNVSNLHVSYGEATVIHDISLYVIPGEIVTVLGANGAGKSTLLRTISGLLRPNKGKIELFGKEIQDLAPNMITRMGLVHVPEGRKLWPRMTVDEHLKLAGRLATAENFIEEERREGVFKMFPRLYERRNQQSGTMSGGEQQMLAIARALMLNPRLLLLDEPSLGLAPVLVEELYRRLEEVNKQGIPILLVEQNVTMALQLSDRSYILELGCIVASGSSSELLRDEEGLGDLYLGVSAEA